jgi:hypothetical protein
MPGHFAEFITKRLSPGVIVVPREAPLRVVIEDLLLIWGASQAAEWTNRLLWIPL